MNLETPFRWIVGLLLLALSAAMPGQCAAQPESEPGVLTLTVAGTVLQNVSDCLIADHPVWQTAPVNAIMLNRTPPLYATDPVDDSTRPVTKAQLVRLQDESIVVRLQWADATGNLAEDGARYPDAGEGHVYKKQTEREDSFADAACLMIPQEKGVHARYPSLMMGEKGAPMELYYWRAGLGFQLLDSHGRSSTALSGKSFPGNAQRIPEGWVALFAVPELPAGTPVSFAVWDGASEQRDGLKFFSVWYEVQ